MLHVLFSAHHWVGFVGFITAFWRKVGCSSVLVHFWTLRLLMSFTEGFQVFVTMSRMMKVPMIMLGISGQKTKKINSRVLNTEREQCFLDDDGGGEDAGHDSVTRRTCGLYGGISNQSWHNDDSTPGLLVLLVDALHHVAPLQLSGMWQMALRQMATLQEFERRPNFNQSHILHMSSQFSIVLSGHN